MNLLELEENKLNEVKKILIADGTICEKNNIKDYDAKFFESVTLSNTLIKFFLFVFILLKMAETIKQIAKSPIIVPIKSIEKFGS